MGVPVYKALAMKAGQPLMDVAPGAQARHMLGNMMHIASVGSVMGVALASVRLLRNASHPIQLFESGCAYASNVMWSLRDCSCQDS